MLRAKLLSGAGRKVSLISDQVYVITKLGLGVLHPLMKLGDLEGPC